VINKSIIFLCNFKVKVTKNAKNRAFFGGGQKIEMMQSNFSSHLSSEVCIATI
jgi:hypothetical protein